MSEPNVSVKQSDLSAGVQMKIIELSLDAYNLKSTRTEIAKAIKESCDRLFGPTWHAFVGSSYGCQVKYAKGFYIFFQIDKVFFCVFKSPPLSQKKPAVKKPTELPLPLPVDSKILVSKMSSEMEVHALQLSEEAAGKYQSYKEMAIHVKDWFDEHYGTGWIVLFGLLNTGSFASRDQVDYISFNLRGKIRVLIYRHHDGNPDEIVLSDVPERYYVQILPREGRVLRNVGFVLIALQIASVLGYTIVFPYFFALFGLLHFLGIYAIHAGWPSVLLQYAAAIAINLLAMGLTQRQIHRWCDKHHCTTKYVDSVIAVFAIAYVVHIAGFLVMAVLFSMVKASIQRVATQSLRPLFTRV